MRGRELGAALTGSKLSNEIGPATSASCAFDLHLAAGGHKPTLIRMRLNEHGAEASVRDFKCADGSPRACPAGVVENLSSSHFLGFSGWVVVKAWAVLHLLALRRNRRIISSLGCCRAPKPVVGARAIKGGWVIVRACRPKSIVHPVRDSVGSRPRVVGVDRSDLVHQTQSLVLEGLRQIWRQLAQRVDGLRRVLRHCDICAWTGLLPDRWLLGGAADEQGKAGQRDDSHPQILGARCGHG